MAIDNILSVMITLLHSSSKYLNFSRSKSDLELMSRRTIAELEGTEDVDWDILKEYCNPDTERYQKMVDCICQKMNFTSLRYNRLDDMLAAVGIDPENLCTYCWNGEE